MVLHQWELTTIWWSVQSVCTVINRSRYGAVLLIMVEDMLISSSNLHSQMFPLWMTFFYVFKLLWSHFPAVTDTCCRCCHHCHTEALSSSLWHSSPMAGLTFQCEHSIHKKGLSHLHCIYHVAFYPSSKIGSLSSCGSLVSLLMTVPSPVSFCVVGNEIFDSTYPSIICTKFISLHFIICLFGCCM